MKVCVTSHELEGRDDTECWYHNLSVENNRLDSIILESLSKERRRTVVSQIT